VIEIHGPEGVRGTIDRGPDGLTGSTPAMQRLADQALKNARGNADEAWEHLLSINSGYSWAIQT
jgi:hypothetical protein